MRLSNTELSLKILGETKCEPRFRGVKFCSIEKQNHKKDYYEKMQQLLKDPFADANEIRILRSKINAQKM
jgi:hypothetical protein